MGAVIARAIATRAIAKIRPVIWLLDRCTNVKDGRTWAVRGVGRNLVESSSAAIRHARPLILDLIGRRHGRDSFPLALAQSRITSRGRITVPADVRRRLGVGPGSVLEWAEDGELVVVRRAGDATSADVHRAAFPDGLPTRRTIAALKEACGAAPEIGMRSVDTSIFKVLPQP